MICLVYTFIPISPMLVVKFIGIQDTQKYFFFFRGIIDKCVCALCCSPALCNPMDCSLPGSSVHSSPQGRLLELVAISYSRGSSQSRDWAHVSCISCIGKHILYTSILPYPRFRCRTVVIPTKRYVRDPCPPKHVKLTLFGERIFIDSI